MTTVASHRRAAVACSPRAVAILMLGGISVTARRLGIAPKTLDLMLAQDVGSWKAGHVQRLAALTGIPMATLMMSHREDQR